MSGAVLYNYDLDIDCYTVRMIAGCLGIALDLRQVDMYPGHEHLSPKMRALSPQGRLPVLVEDALVLTQPLAIILHLAETRCPDHPLLPQAAITGARMLDWMTFAAREMGVAAEARATAMLDAPGDLAALKDRAKRAFRLLDDHLTLQGFDGLGFVAGPEVTLADLMLFAPFALSRDFGLDHDAFPALRLWARRVRATPGFSTMPGIPDER
ncbi:glutathione S-transferase family protein [Pararhodobacter marinus]|uniref:glutathione S-transferase family protein n=1 Tax=Pararhodobacter marinus TaxID=2184063 RepID=UPI0035182E05